MQYVSWPSRRARPLFEIPEEEPVAHALRSPHETFCGQTVPQQAEARIAVSCVMCLDEIRRRYRLR